MARFLRKAELAARLNHPYAAHLYSFGAEPDGVCWIAMEHVHGTPLSTVLVAQPDGRMPLAQGVALLDRLAEVVATAHEQGIVHRDLKPGNVMVQARAGRLVPRLLDLGIVRCIAELSLVDAGGPVGSPPYMAPEQWRGDALDERTDLYALAVVAYEALTGRRPFAGDTLALARAHAAAAVPPVPADLPAALDAVFARALAKDRASRYATALELAASVRSAAGLSTASEALPPLAGAARTQAQWRRIRWPRRSRRSRRRATRTRRATRPGPWSTRSRAGSRSSRWPPAPGSGGAARWSS